MRILPEKQKKLLIKITNQYIEENFRKKPLPPKIIKAYNEIDKILYKNKLTYQECMYILYLEQDYLLQRIDDIGGPQTVKIGDLR